MENTPTQTLELAPVKPQELTRIATDVAGLCKEIVVKTALEIQGKKYVKVEGWQSIATAHGCIACSRDVVPEYLPDGKTLIGYKAAGEIRRMDGTVIGTAEGYIGRDETTWFGGMTRVWDKVARAYVDKELPKRPDYAIRAMVQTRAISRVCRAAFAHVVVLMDAGLSTTPAEEVPPGGFDDAAAAKPKAEPTRTANTTVASDKKPTPTKSANPPAERSDWKAFKVPFGKNKGVALGELPEKTLRWYCENIEVQETYEAGGEIKKCSAENIRQQQAFRDALDEAVVECNWSDNG